MSEYNTEGGRPSIRIRIRQLLWSIVQVTLFRMSPFICYGWRRFLLRSFGAKIAKTATIGRLARIDAPWNLEMDDKSMICNNAWVMCYGKISVGRYSLIGEYVRVLSGSHDSNSTSYVGIAKPIIIEDNCWIASCAILASGGKKLTIGEGGIVGAGSVVMRNVKPWTVVVGNPAKFLVDRELKKA